MLIIGYITGKFLKTLNEGCVEILCNLCAPFCTFELISKWKLKKIRIDDTKTSDRNENI